MARILLFFITTLFCSTSLLGQEIQVFSEDFNGNTHIFTLNSGLVGDNTGNNTWIVNKEYVGTPLYGNTLNQDSVVTGQINGSPFSKYLHIHDSEARINQDIANANFDPTSASDRFAHFGEAVCTKSLFNVTLTFYYLVEGNDNAYGEVWFSKDFGPWQQVGPNKLTNADKWQRLDITDTRFDNTENLRFGFRWVNTSNSGPTSTSLSIDELNVVADYDEVNNPVEITTTPLDDTICRSNPILMRVSLSDSLCEGVYLFEISEPGGSFNNPENLGTVAWGGPPTFFVNVPVPSDYQTGVCYRMRVTRIQPPPLLRSDVSDCFYLEDCRPQISTMQPPVTIGSGPGGGSGGGLGGGYVLCAGSVIDVPFTSVGTILEDNLYIAVLSQEIDTLPNGDIVLVKGDTIGSVPDPNPHPFPPGNVSGKIPLDAAEGCNYYVQIFSTSPAAPGTLYGPFCIRKCDITTNDGLDLNVCISDDEGHEEQIAVELNTWADSIDYFLGNEFLVQILESQFFTVVNTGGFGATLDTSLNQINLDIPDFETLDSLGIIPGMYYMRIIATDNNGANDTMGTLVRLIIGRIPSDTSYAIAADSVICRGDQMTWSISPFDPFTGYEWEFGDGRTFNASGPSFTFNTVGAPANDYRMRVREINFGCPGPWSPWDTITLIGPPVANIFGKDEVCQGDTIQYKAPFNRKTFYEWDPSQFGQLLNKGNNETFMVFDSAGQWSISLSVLNKCGSDAGFKFITVYEKPQAKAGQDRSVCKGDTIEVEGGPDNMERYFWLKGNSIVERDSVLTVKLTSTQSYILYVEGEGGCASRDTVVFTAVDPDPVQTDSVVGCYGDDATFGTPIENAAYNWSTGETTDSITVNEEGSYYLTITDHGELCPDEREFIVRWQNAPQTDTVRPCKDDPAELGTEIEDGEYLWSTGETSDSITVEGEGIYSVTVDNFGGVCPFEKNYLVTYKLCEAKFDVPNAFSPNGDGLNDQFNVVGDYFDVLELEIYNRWGELMYRTTDLSQGWDGTFRGKNQDPGVYTWVVTYEDDFGEQFVETGNVTLIR